MSSQQDETSSGRISLLLIPLGAIVPILLLLATWSRPNAASGPHLLNWQWPNGEGIVVDPDDAYPWSGCRPNDIGMGMLRVGSVIWTACDAPDGTFPGHNIGMARLDPASGIGTIYPFPKQAPHSFTEAVALALDGSVAFVYSVDVVGQTFITVFDGTSFSTPVPLAPTFDTDVLAARYVGDTLEVIYRKHSVLLTKSDELQKDSVSVSPWRTEGERTGRCWASEANTEHCQSPWPLLARLRDGNLETSRFPAPKSCTKTTGTENASQGSNATETKPKPGEFSSGNRKPANSPGCPFVCRVMRKDGQWELWWTQGSVLRSVTMASEPIDIDGNPRECDALSFMGRELSALGLVAQDTYDALGDPKARSQALDGSLTKIVRPGERSEQEAGVGRAQRTQNTANHPDATVQRFQVSDWHDLDSQGLHRHRAWQMPGDSLTLAWRFQNKWLELSVRPPADTLRLQLMDDSNQLELSKDLVRVPIFHGGSLIAGVLVSTGRSSHLVSQDGFYIEVSDTFERLDPVSVFEHLRARGSINPQWDERAHVYRYLWVLLGLPICLLLGAAISAMSKLAMYKSQAWAAGFYLITGIHSLWKVLPLLS